MEAAPLRDLNKSRGALNSFNMESTATETKDLFSLAKCSLKYQGIPMIFLGILGGNVRDFLEFSASYERVAGIVLTILWVLGHPKPINNLHMISLQ